MKDENEGEIMKDENKGELQIRKRGAEAFMPIVVDHKLLVAVCEQIEQANRTALEISDGDWPVGKVLINELCYVLIPFMRSRVSTR